ncbi:alanine--tRNA ligase [Candidatus Dependentiae bacterium]|nr:alanine--tRNA ligase [Candidatus Dependentiae bacterium]
MNSLDLRKKFFDYFVKNGHEKVSSSSLIPAQDPTLLFANAGMNQFKDVFLGKENRSYKRAVSIQKCIRAGGKHNDLDNVGFTKRHLTFFEMMGNFSFGDYFKKDAIKFAWEFLTEHAGLDKNKLYASVYKDDNEAYEIWNKEIGLPTGRIVRLGEADNFWQMGDTGPCGPCSEIYIDRGSDFGCNSKACAPGCHCDRFLEIWNLVFMQFDRQPDGSFVPLKQTGVDTGMGLERLCSVVQNKESVFDTDLFKEIIEKIEQLSGKKYQSSNDEIKAAFRVIADHIRSSSFAIADGCSPSNEGRGYVLRKIIRRAALFAQKLSDNNIFPDVADALIEKMGPIYPELVTNKQLIKSLLKSEIEKFSTNLIHGQEILNKYFIENSAKKVISGSQAFKLYDTYGFPLELTILIAQENGFTVDKDVFEQEMEKQRSQSGKKIEAEQQAVKIEGTTIFTGYEELETESKIKNIIVENNVVSAVKKGETCFIVPEKTPFYVECGGQINDQGFVIIKGEKTKILDLKKIDGSIAVKIVAPVDFAVGEKVKQVVEKDFRANTMKNHTATHLLQAALINVLGKTVKQAGSVVTPDYLRFDFTYHENPTAEQVKRIEDIVNRKIMENIPTKIQETTYKKAVDSGVIAFFGEKYNPESVRVVEVPGFSKELCGGTHVKATGDIGVFKITEIGALSAGTRRIVAVTGPKAVELFQNDFAIVKTLCQEFKVTQDKVLDFVEKQKEQLKLLQTQVNQLRKKMWKAELQTWQKQIENISSVPTLILLLEDYSIPELKDIATELLSVNPGLYFLMSNSGDKSVYYSAVSPMYSSIVNLQDLNKFLKENLKLQGGGSATNIQGGGPKLDKTAIEKIKSWIRK